MDHAPVVQRQQRHTVDRRGLARNAVMVHGIDAIGRDVHLKQVSTAHEFVHAFDGNATQGKVFRKLPVVHFERGQVLAQPIRQDVHSYSEVPGSGIMRFINSSNRGTVNTVSPWLGLQIIPLLIRLCRKGPNAFTERPSWAAMSPDR